MNQLFGLQHRRDLLCTNKIDVITDSMCVYPNVLSSDTLSQNKVESKK